MQTHILIIDADRDLCRALGESLTLKGHQATACHSASEALATLAARRYDLILADVRLPDLAGLEFCRRLRAAPGGADTPVLLMTSLAPEEAELQTLREALAPADVLFKPFPLAELWRRIALLPGLAPPPRSARPEQVETRGRLAETSFGRLLHNLYTLKCTGLLQVERGAVKKVVYLRDGYPIFARSNVVRECLGQMLVEEGRISAEQCAASLEQARASWRLQGTVLIEMGLLTPHQLHDTLRQQVTEKLLEIFSWDDGEYRVIQGRRFKQGITGIDLSPAALIYQGLRRHVTAARLARLLTPYRERYLARAELPQVRFQDIGLTARDEKVLALCDGTRTLEAICARFPLARHDTEQLLAALLISEMVVARDQPQAAPRGEDGPAAEENRKLREQLIEDYGRMIRLDYFALLGVGPDASRETMRKAYFALAKQYHPDRFLRQELPDELKSKLNELFQRIGEGYETLSDPVRRQTYRQRLQSKGEPKKHRVEDILKAETAFQKGRHLLRARKYAEALAELSVSRELSPEEPEYLTLYAWAYARSHPEDPEVQRQARQMLIQSSYLNGQLYQTHLYLGQLLKAEGKLKEAEKRFEMALQCNPDCTEALRELRLSSMRKDAEKKSKGLLDKLLRK